MKRFKIRRFQFKVVNKGFITGQLEARQRFLAQSMCLNLRHFILPKKIFFFCCFFFIIILRSLVKLGCICVLGVFKGTLDPEIKCGHYLLTPLKLKTFIYTNTETPVL